MQRVRHNLRMLMVYRLESCAVPRFDDADSRAERPESDLDALTFDMHPCAPPHCLGKVFS
jgi:hypothetical protein